MDVLNVSPKQFYRAFITKMNHTSAAFLWWQDAPDQNYRIFSQDEWKDLSSNVYKATRETRLQALHFKIINRIIPCGTYLRQIKIADSETCALCGQQDSLSHFFYDCPRNRAFWRSIFRWFERIEDLNLEEIPPKHLLLGLPQLAPRARKINAILISIKSYIHRQRLFHQGHLDLLHWLREFRSRLLIEKEILAKENKSARFTKWRRIMDALG